jgi:hypothetical protein
MGKVAEVVFGVSDVTMEEKADQFIEKFGEFTILIGSHSKVTDMEEIMEIVNTAKNGEIIGCD